MESQAASTICIRPSYIWPSSSVSKQQQLYLCKEEGICIRSGARRRQLAGLFVGHGPAASDVAVASSQILAGSLAPQLLQNEQYNLAPLALEAAFLQCHQQLLQLQPKQVVAANSSPGSTLDTATSGASAVVLCLDQAQQKMLVASSGLCKAVMARSSTAGDLTVIELTPRLALGHDPIETARLDAAGSSIHYQQPLVTAATAGVATSSAGDSAEVHADATNSIAASDSFNNSAAWGGSRSSVTRSTFLSQHDAVLVDPEGNILQDVGASRMLGFSSAAAAGVLANPVVTSWRLTGSESFVVLGSPGLWKAMNPAEVVDYVAAALANGVPGSSTSCSSGNTSTPVAAAAAVSVGDLLTLEAQERLKLKLMDQLVACCPGPEVGPVTSGVVPDVTAAVLLLDDSPALHSAGVNRAMLEAELAKVSRACRCNAEAHSLQALWSASCFCCDLALAGPPAPAVSNLLPALSVAGHCWPSTFWPAYDGAVTAPAAMPAAKCHAHSSKPGSCNAAAADAGARDPGAVAAVAATEVDSSGKLSLLEAARSAGILQGNSSAPQRASGFALNSRLSCELDLSHDHGSYGSCGCLAECPHSCSEDSPAEQQSLIVHKVRLSGPCELESLLFGKATTSHPDTTVARILKPSTSMASWSSTEALSPRAIASRSLAAGNVRMHQEAHQRQLPRRSASVTIAALASRNMRCTSSSNSSSGGGADGWTLQEAAAAADSRRSGWGLEGKDGSLTAVTSSLYSPTSPVRAISQDRQLQQLDSGTVKKARSYQALSALQAAGLRTAASVPTPVSLTAHMAHSSSNSTTAGLVMSHSAVASVLQQGVNSAGGAVAFRSAFRSSSSTASQGVHGSAKVQRHPELQRAWTAVAAVTGGANVGGVAQLLQQQQQATPMSLSCPTEGLSLEAHGAEGKVRGGVGRDRQSSFRLAQEDAAGAVAEALQSAVGQLEDKQDMFEGKVRGGRRGSSGISTDDLIAAAAAAAHNNEHNSSSTLTQQVPVTRWKTVSSSIKANQQQQLSQPLPSVQIQQPVPLRLEHCVRGGRAKSAQLRKVMTSPDLPSLAAQQAAADSAYEAAAITVARATLKTSRSVRSSWDGAAAVSDSGVAVTPPAAAGTRAIPVPGGVKGLKLPKLLRKKKPGSGSSSNSRSASKEGSELALRLSGSSIRSGSSGVNSRGSSIELGYSTPQSAHKMGASVAAAATATATAAAAVVSTVTKSKSDSGFATAMPHSILNSVAVSSRLGSSFSELASVISDSGSISFSAGVAAADAAGTVQIDQPSNCLLEVLAADGAVHGGELGDEALEGQMHGGKRSNSMSLSGSMLLPSLDFTSSGGDDPDLIRSLSFSSAQQQQQHSLFICSSMSESGGSHQRQPNSLAAAAARGSSNPDVAALQSPFANAATSSSAAGQTVAAPAAATVLPEQPPSIQVIRTESGTFTRVRLAVSAPAAGGGCSTDSLAGAGSNSLGSSSSQNILGQEQQQYTVSAVQLQHLTDGSLDGGGQVLRRVHSSTGVQVIQQAASVGAEMLPRSSSNSSSSTGKSVHGWTSSRAWGAGSRSSSAIQFGRVSLPPTGFGLGGAGMAAAANGSAGEGNRGSSSGRGSLGVGSDSESVGSSGSMVFRSAFSNIEGAAGSCDTASNTGNTRYSSTTRLSFGDVLDDCHHVSDSCGGPSARAAAASIIAATALTAAATAAAAETGGTSSLAQGVLSMQHSGPPKRQRSISTPLPTLQESPAPTPGSSPQLLTTGSGCSSRCVACSELPATAGLTEQQMQEQLNSLQDQLGLIAEHQQHQCTQPQPVPTMEEVVADGFEQTDAASPVSVSASGLACSFEDHSLADFDRDDCLDGNGNDVVRDLHHQEPPPCGRRSGKSFEFSRPHAMLDACYDSPAHLGDSPLLLG